MIGFFESATKYVRLDRAKARADADFFQLCFLSVLTAIGLSPKSAASFRDQHTFAATQEYSRESGAGGNHA